MATKILLNGYAGRMGQAITQSAPDEDCEIAVALDAGDTFEVSAAKACEAFIDFSFHAVTPEITRQAVELGKPVVIGTTGHTDEEREAILKATESIPVVWSGNFSVGVNVLFYLTKRAAEILGEAYDPELIEMHHRHKKDAPSGTAEALIEIVRNARGFDKSAIRNGREGETGERPDKEIGVHALRGGEIVGEHSMLFTGVRDRIELTHRAYDRAIFASGALRAAKWAIGKKPGLYNMEDVLGLKEL